MGPRQFTPDQGDLTDWYWPIPRLDSAAIRSHIAKPVGSRPIRQGDNQLSIGVKNIHWGAVAATADPPGVDYNGESSCSASDGLDEAVGDPLIKVGDPAGEGHGFDPIRTPKYLSCGPTG